VPFCQTSTERVDSGCGWVGWRMKKNRTSRITVDLLEHKQAWLDLCEKNGVTPSDAIRSAVAHLIARQAQATTDNGSQPVSVGEPEKATVRKKIGLTPSESDHIAEIAAAEGFSVAKWLVALVRNRLTGTPQFGQAELELLARSNLNLLAIGRNLNQLVKVLNSSSRDPSVYRSTLSETIKEIESAFKDHTKKVSNVMIANVERWRIK